jgi:hypothetical protein
MRILRHAGRLAAARSVRFPIGVLLAILLGPAGGAARAALKVDVLVLRNGDRLTGEIKQMKRGKLSFKTDATETISVEWTDLAGLTSPQHLEVEDFLGDLYFGQLVEGAEPGHLLVAGFDSSRDLTLTDIVRITPIEDRFLSRLNGALSLGYTYSQSSGVTTFSLSSSVNYRVRKYLYGFEYNTNSTRQETGTKGRSEATLRWERFLKRRWFTDWEAGAEANEELGLDQRLLLTGTVGQDVIQTNRVIFAFAGGLSYNREKLLSDGMGGGEPTSNLEAVGKVSYDIFHDRNPQTDVMSALTLYPSLTDWGRVRGDLDITLAHELFKDFFWRLRLKETYDSSPGREDVPTSDFFVDTSLGWSF